MPRRRRKCKDDTLGIIPGFDQHKEAQAEVPGPTGLHEADTGVNLAYEPVSSDSPTADFQWPLHWWREHEMPKVTQIPTALLYGGGLVQEGDMFPVLAQPDRRVKLVSAVPDPDGYVSVQEVYRIEPDKIGLDIRPETVVLELTRDEAVAVVEFYQKTHTSETAVPVLDELNSTVSDPRG